MIVRHWVVAGVIGLALGTAPAYTVAEVVAVVSARSTVVALSRNQIADLFLGRVRRFPNGTVVVPFDQAEDSAARDEFYAKYTGRTPAQLKAHWSKIIFTGRGRPPVAISNVDELKRRIAANPAAIGYLDRTRLDASVREIR